jgi:ribosomal protein S18 acetylase RimI-like enzyme
MDSKSLSKVGLDFEVRRIFLENEVREIRTMQTNAPEFDNYYPNHNQWLDMAVSEVISGKRVAFGIYKPAFGSNLSPTVKLVGSVILKKGLYANVVEMKNLFVEEDFRGKGYGTALCDVAEKHCSKEGYSIIETEVATDKIETIKFLLKRGYRVNVTEESVYEKGKYFYTMLKVLPTLYDGDYFDLHDLFSWLFEHIYGFSNINVDRSNNTITFNLGFETLANRIVKNKIPVPKGIMMIFDKKEIIDKETVNRAINKMTSYNLIFLFGRRFDSDAKTECRKRNILLFDENLVLDSFRDLFADKPPQFKKEEIAGIIVAINPVYFQRLKTQKQQFTYFKGKSIGKYLAKNNKVLFFVESSPEFPKGGVAGYADILDVCCGAPSDIWEKTKGKNPIFTDREYKAFTGTKRTILAITADNFKEISPISFNNVKKIVEHEIDIDSLGHYYISENMLNRFYEGIKSKSDEEEVYISPDAPRVFISSTIRDLEKERKSLKRAIEFDLEYHTYISEAGGSGYPGREHILEKLKSSDIYICLVGGRYGLEFEVDGNKVSATEDEFNHAKKWNIPIYVYVKKVPEREDKVREFLKRIGDYLQGSLWQEFTTPKELIKHVKSDIAELWTKKKKK